MVIAYNPDLSAGLCLNKVWMNAFRTILYRVLEPRGSNFLPYRFVSKMT